MNLLVNRSESQVRMREQLMSDTDRRICLQLIKLVKMFVVGWLRPSERPNVAHDPRRRSSQAQGPGSFIVTCEAEAFGVFGTLHEVRKHRETAASEVLLGTYVEDMPESLDHFKQELLQVHAMFICLENFSDGSKGQTCVNTYKNSLFSFVSNR